MNVYEVVTDRIVKQLEAGTVPWQRPWVEGEPRNLVSRKNYRGVNVFLLGSQGYASPWFLTYKQAQELGGNVRKGEKGTPVVFWKWREEEQDQTNDKKERNAPILRYYTVFNVTQCDGVDAPPSEHGEPVAPIAECDRIVSAMPQAPAITHGEARAYYRPSLDVVNMPRRELFNSSEEYYSVLFHELTHATGHQSRLNRATITEMCPFGSTNYSKEELIAEMGAAFLCATARIENCTIDNSAAYIASWLRKLRNDSRLVIMAAAQAQKAADFIKNAPCVCTV